MRFRCESRAQGNFVRRRPGSEQEPSLHNSTVYTFPILSSMTPQPGKPMDGPGFAPPRKGNSRIFQIHQCLGFGRRESGSFLFASCLSTLTFADDRVLQRGMHDWREYEIRRRVEDAYHVRDIFMLVGHQAAPPLPRRFRCNSESKSTCLMRNLYLSSVAVHNTCIDDVCQ